MFKTKDGRIINVEEFTWSEAREFILPFDPLLVTTIDDISPDDSLKLYKASYPFGDKIIDKAEAFLPLDNGGLISFNDPALPTQLRKNLSYNPTTSNPAGITLEKKSDCYISIAGHIMPYATTGPGELFGLTRTLDALEMSNNPSARISFFIWELTSGARFTFMLPKISENISHNRLKKKYGLTCDKPQSLQDHWTAFKNIAKKCDSNWRSSFLFFSNNWFEKLDEPNWLRLYCYFLRDNRADSEFWRSILSWQISFNLVERAKNIHHSSYILDNAKHLFAIAAGSLTGFRPATNEDAVPIKLIQEAYVQEYGLTDYWPVIMEPAALSLRDKQPVYYSLNHPTLILSDQNAFKGNSIITLLDELSGVVEKYVNGIQSNQLDSATLLYKAAKNFQFSYYHPEPAGYANIKDVELIAKEDARFKSVGKTGAFPRHASFLKGCIKIAPID